MQGPAHIALCLLPADILMGTALAEPRMPHLLSTSTCTDQTLPALRASIESQLTS